MNPINRSESKDFDIKEPVDVSALEADTRGIPEEIAALSEEDYNATVKRIVRKADCVIMFVLSALLLDCTNPRPIMGILYVLNYIDRQNLAAAKLQGIMEDLDMTTQQFATAISILFVGYLPFQLPSNLIISRLTRPGLCGCPQISVQDQQLTNRYLLRVYDLGIHLGLYRLRPDIRSTTRCACPSGGFGGGLLPWSNLPAFGLVLKT